MTGERPTVFYVSGPMRGVPFFNAPAFAAVTHELRARGHEVISPEEHDRAVFIAHGLDLDTDTPPWYERGDELGLRVLGLTTTGLMAWDIEQVQACDAVVFLPNWDRSLGARCEARAALDRDGISPYFYAFDLEANDLRLLLRSDVERVLSDVLEVEPIEIVGPTDEVRVVNATTGGAKGAKLARFDLLPPGPLRTVAEHYGAGASKYEDRNWERGYDWSLSFAAMQRHAWQFWNGEDVDADSGMPHLSAVVFHAFALMEFARTHPELDDRSKS